ncbi:MAG: imidazole glycerol phosphate synthase subunit HisH [Gammaproteobacteria bacterium]|nr:imidazole glycerol phosphate synthase subunit HisH [Gammaproteobacteria bacterium]MDE2250551.1 imidazole glycerol phosphate synthase subunit HisH [Gammaproteobacteria bacterium]
MSDADVVIIESGGANLASLHHALLRLGARSRVSADPAVIAAAPRLLLPGVGAAADAMSRLRGHGLADLIRTLRQPLLGICLGMQLLYEHSEEGDTPGLGLLAGEVRRIPPAPGRPVPHMGWNTCRPLQGDPLFNGIGAADYFYFVHSYAAAVTDCCRASVDYGEAWCAVARRDNYCGVQFHPERSGRAGARLLRNFLES